MNAHRSAGRGPRTHAVVLDALGTLLRLRPAASRLRAELRARGVEVAEADAARAFASEVAYYLDHHLEGSTPAAVERLRDRCARVVATELGLEERVVPTARAALLAAISFEPYADAAPALAALRDRGIAAVVASNWDCSLEGVLGRAGLRPLIAAVVTSAQVGAAKPRPEPFLAALSAAGCAPGDALLVGDSLAADVAGARAAGIRAALLVRDGNTPPGVPAGVPVLRSLAEVDRLVSFAR